MKLEPARSQGSHKLLNINTKLTWSRSKQAEITSSLQRDVRGPKEDCHRKLPFLF